LFVFLSLFCWPWYCLSFELPPLISHLVSAKFHNVSNVCKLQCNYILPMGLEPLCFKPFKLMFKYYNRLIKIEQSKDYVYDLLRSTFDEDKQLHSQNCLSLGKSVEQLKTIFNLDTLDLSFSLICDPFADPIISLHSRDISLFDCHI
jgi:hypothetical protein